MIDINIVLLVLFLHFVGDFIFQTRKMAENKWYSTPQLTYHVITYSSVFFMWPSYAFVNMFLHLIVDSVTSVISHDFYKRSKIKLFWIIIGLDQFLHAACLIITLPLFIPIWELI